MKSAAQDWHGLAKKVVNTLRLKKQRQPPDAALNVIEGILSPLDSRFRSPLLSMYRGEQQLGTDGRPHSIDKQTLIPASQGMWLYDLCMSIKPKTTIEIGLAYGYSTLYFLAANAKCQIGRHTAVDPFQHSHWNGIGLAHAQSLAPVRSSESAFQLIEELSDRAAIDLVRSSRTFEIIFIDGNHRFDGVLVDFHLYAPLCVIGGHIVFDDMWMSSIQTAVAFVRANRTDFAEIHTAERNICVFQKVSDDRRKWSTFRKFTVSRDTE